MDADEYIEKLEERLGELDHRRVYKAVLLGALIVIPALFLTRYFLAFSLLVVTATTSILVNRFELNSFGIETVTFSAVILGRVFGPEVGAGLAFISIMLQMMIGSPPGIYILWVVPGYTAAGFIAGMMTATEVFLFGAATVVGLQSGFLFFTAVLMPSQLGRYVPYAVLNVLFNIVLFKAFATPLLSMVV